MCEELNVAGIAIWILHAILLFAQTNGIGMFTGATTTAVCSKCILHDYRWDFISTFESTCMFM